VFITVQVGDTKSYVTTTKSKSVLVFMILIFSAILFQNLEILLLNNIDFA
jgi:hypothetical protein